MLECEKMYVRIEMKFNMTNEDIRDRHQKFLAGQKSGEMNLQNFIEYAKKEKNMTAYLAESLFRWRNSLVINSFQNTCYVVH